jgi:hypothetical protein
MTGSHQSDHGHHGAGCGEWTDNARALLVAPATPGKALNDDTQRR